MFLYRVPTVPASPLLSSSRSLRARARLSTSTLLVSASLDCMAVRKSSLSRSLSLHHNNHSNNKKNKLQRQKLPTLRRMASRTNRVHKGQRRRRVRGLVVFLSV